MLERVLDTSLQLYLFDACILIKKNLKISHTNTNPFKDFSANTLCVKHIPDFLQL